MKIIQTIFLVVALILTSSIYAQKGTTYYVAPSVLNLRSAPNTSSEVLTKLYQYDNVEYLEKTTTPWIKVRFEDVEGYVHQDYVEEGRAIVTTTSYRIGAVCKDGTLSSATGRGACSHHGGVAKWRYRENRSVRIEKD